MNVSQIFFSVLAVTLVGSSGHAGSVSEYVKHGRLKGETRKNGKFDVDFVQLIARPGKPLTSADRKINASLFKSARESLCDNGPQGEWTSEVNIKSDVSFVSDRLLAVQFQSDISCAGAAHPSFGASSEIYDRKLGQSIDIRTGKAVSYDGTEATGTLKAINDLILAEMAKQALIEKTERGEEDDGCDDRYQPESLSFFASDIRLTSKALVVQSDEAHATMACQFVTTIPLEKFIGVADEGSLLAELAAGARK